MGPTVGQILSVLDIIPKGVKRRAYYSKVIDTEAKGISRLWEEMANIPMTERNRLTVEDIAAAAAAEKKKYNMIAERRA